MLLGWAAVGPVRSAWWAVWDRERGVLAQRTRIGRAAGVHFEKGGRLIVRDRRASMTSWLTRAVRCSR